MVGILFIVALILAWPTFGLSLVAWFVLAWFKARQKVAGINRREELKTVIEPLFQERFSDFFYALDMPTAFDEELTEQEAHQCGRHVMNYLAHNPSEAAIFMKGLEKWRTKGSPTLCDPVTAASDEKNLNAKGEIHLTSYRAVEAVMTNNAGLRCFSKISLPQVALNRSTLEVNLFSRPG